MNSGVIKPGQKLQQRGVARYHQLAQLFRRRIETGDWAYGDRIPTVEELSQQCEVARETVRQALGILASEGLVTRYRAKGTFVSGKPKEHLWCELQTSFFGLLQAREGVKIELVSESRKVQPPSPLDFGIAAPSYRRLKRRHWMADEPYLYTEVYLDEHFANRIPRSAFSTKTALKIIADVPGLQIDRVEQIMTIGAADIEVAEGLQMSLNAPVAHVDRYAMDENDRLILFARGVYRADVVRLSIKLK